MTVVAKNLDNGYREVAERTTILRATVGSNVHGLALEGTDDRDEMGVCVEPPESAIGLDRFEQWVYRTQPEGAPSGHGDLDLTVYSLRKYVALALVGNPTILLLLFAAPEVCSVRTWLGVELQSLAPRIVARSSGERFLGYLKDQRERLNGERGGRALRKERTWSEDSIRVGYDTKYAMHMVRLGLQGVELLEDGRITLPMPEPARSTVFAIRKGQKSFDAVMGMTAALEFRLAELLDTSPLQAQPDREFVERWMVNAYLDDWRSRRV